MKCILKMTLLMVLGLYCLNPLSAQEEKTTQYAVKLYYNYQPNAMSYLTPSLSIQKPKASHEFELSRLRVGTSNRVYVTEGDSGQDVFDSRYDYNFGIRLKYEYGFKFLAINEKINFSLHASAEPYFNFFKTDNNSDIQGRSGSGSTIGGQLHLIPRGIYDISERWFIDVNFPIELMNIYRTKSYSRTQGYERLSRQNNFNFFDNLLRMRVGIGLKL